MAAAGRSRLNKDHGFFREITKNQESRKLYHEQREREVKVMKEKVEHDIRTGKGEKNSSEEKRGRNNIEGKGERSDIEGKRGRNDSEGKGGRNSERERKTERMEEGQGRGNIARDRKSGRRASYEDSRTRPDRLLYVPPSQRSPGNKGRGEPVHRDSDKISFVYRVEVSPGNTAEVLITSRTSVSHVAEQLSQQWAVEDDILWAIQQDLRSKMDGMGL